MADEILYDDINRDALKQYFNEAKKNKTLLKVFLTGNPVKVTMLSGIVKNFDDICCVLDECLIMYSQIVSISKQ